LGCSWFAEVAVAKDDSEQRTMTIKKVRMLMMMLMLMMLAAGGYQT